MNSTFRRVLALCLMLCLVASVAAANLSFDMNQDGKTTVWDLQQVQDTDQAAALEEALGGKDELHKNADGHWEIWTKLGLYHMAELAQSGDTFVLMQDIDLEGDYWRPIENFKGKLVGNCYTVSNMRITADIGGNMGFFASIAEQGSVEYLNLKELNVIASEDAINIGLLAGTCAGTIDGSTTVGFVTDCRTTLPSDVYVGGMAGKMLAGGRIISRDINKLPEEGAEQAIHTISAKIATRFTALTDSAYVRVVGIVGDGVDAVDVGTLLQDLTGTMPDPNALAWVVTGENAVYPHSLAELLEAIDPSGNTVITLQADLTNGHEITIPYSCTLDCNGYTVTADITSGNCLVVSDAGTENQTFTIKNGTLKYRVLGVRVNKGAVVISNMEMVGYAGACLGIYDNTASYAAINRIENSTLSSATWGCVAFNKASTDFSGTGITISNSDLIAHKEGGSYIFVNASGATPGTVTFENNVNLYSYKSSLTEKTTLAGVDPVKLEQTASVAVDGVAYTGLNHWTTDESVISTETIAEVTNGSTTTQVTNATDMIAAISSDGTTQIKLVNDMVRNSTLTIPYSCTIDLNGHSISNASGNAITINGVGTQNTVTTIKNGTLNHGTIGVRVNAGAINLSELNINGTGSCAASVGFYDPDGRYRADNKIDNCTIYNPNYYCIMYYGTDVDFHETGVSISNTTLVAAKNYVFSVTTTKMSGIVDLCEGVEIYSPKKVVANGSLYRFLGRTAYRSEQNSVTVNGTTVTGVNHWSTDIQKDVINILLIGSSFSTTIPEELYNIATNAGYTVNVCNLYYPGCKAWQHWDWLNNDIANYQYRHQNEMGNYIRRGDMATMKDALDDMDWDHIVYQDGYTREFAATLDQLYANYQEPTNNILSYLKTNYPDAELYFYQHWAWQVGHNETPTLADQEAMFQRVYTASHKFADDNGFALIPCGEAWEIARDNPLVGDTLCDTDLKHDGGPGGGQYLNGCVFFETIFKDSCIGDTWRASNGPSDEKHIELQKAAHQSIMNLYGESYIK